MSEFTNKNIWELSISINPNFKFCFEIDTTYLKTGDIIKCLMEYCIKFDADNNDCGIYKIDHEEMFDFDYHKNATQNKVDFAMKFFSNNFYDYLEKITIGQIKDFIRLGI